MRLIDADALEMQLNTKYDFLFTNYGGYDYYTTVVEMNADRSD